MRKSATKAKPAKAPKAKKPAGDNNAVRDRVVRFALRDFSTSPPPGAETGLYHATQNDKWGQGKGHAIDDGAYRVAGSEWVFVFSDGHLVQAIANHRKTFLPQKITSIPATVDAAA